MQNSGHLSADRWSHALRSDQNKINSHVVEYTDKDVVVLANKIKQQDNILEARETGV